MLGMLGMRGDAGGGMGRSPQLPGRGEHAARVSQVWALLPFSAFGYLSSPPPFSSFPLPLFSYAVGAARQPGSAQPPSVLPPSLPLPHPSLFLKNVGSGVQPPALAASLTARAALSPPPPAEPLFVPCPGPALLDVPAGSGAGSGAALEAPAAGKHPPRFIANFGLSLLCRRGAGAPLALCRVWGHQTACGALTGPQGWHRQVGTWGHPAAGRGDGVSSPHVPVCRYA